MPSTQALLFFLIPLIFLFTKLLRWGRREAHLPPGPPTIPLLGNALQFPNDHMQLQYVIVLSFAATRSHFIL